MYIYILMYIYIYIGIPYWYSLLRDGVLMRPNGRMELNSAIQNKLVTRYKYITYYILHTTYYI